MHQQRVCQLITTSNLHQCHSNKPPRTGIASVISSVHVTLHSYNLPDEIGVQCQHTHEIIWFVLNDPTDWKGNRCNCRPLFGRKDFPCLEQRNSLDPPWKWYINVCSPAVPWKSLRDASISATNTFPVIWMWPFSGLKGLKGLWGGVGADNWSTRIDAFELLSSDPNSCLESRYTSTSMSRWQEFCLHKSLFPFWRIWNVIQPVRLEAKSPSRPPFDIIYNLKDCWPSQSIRNALGGSHSRTTQLTHLSVCTS
jgi:hypothetical protein